MVDFVLPHDPAWATAFDTEALAIRASIDALSQVHHIGSTSIPGILAKPIIDMLGVVVSLDGIDAQSRAFEILGYEVMGAFGIEGRRYFRKVSGSGVRTHHLHVFASGSPHIARHLAFRDYLRAHVEVAAEYSALKAKLTQDGSASWDGYIDGKDPFIKRVERDALLWYEHHTDNGHP